MPNLVFVANLSGGPHLVLNLKSGAGLLGLLRFSFLVADSDPSVFRGHYAPPHELGRRLNPGSVPSSARFAIIRGHSGEPGAPSLQRF
jgi:hypothetical protein